MEVLADPRSTNLMRAVLAVGLSAAALTGCTNSAESSTPVPVETTVAPEPTPSVTPTLAPKPRPEDPIITLQRNLNKQLVPLGMPALELDGKEGPQTNRAECAIRLFTGHKASKHDATPSEMRTFTHRQTLSTELSGFVVSKTCQVMGVNLDGRLSMIIPVSTGQPGHTTPTTNGRINHGRFGWHNSSLYPDERGNGNMYKPLYFRGAIAVHGSNAMYDSVTTPRSHGCIRVSVDDANTLWKLADGPKKAHKDAWIEGLTPIQVHVLD